MSRLVLLVAAVVLGAGALILVFTSNDGPEPLAAEARGAAGDVVALAEEPEVETAPSDQARSEADRAPSSRVDESPVREAAGRLRVEVRLDGAPLASAEVRAIAWSTERAALADREAGLPPSVVEAALSAQTDDDGVVVLPLATLRADAVFLAVRGPGSGPGGLVVPLPADRATVDVPREQVMSGGIWTWPDPVLLPGATVFARRAYRAEAEVRDAFDPVLRVAGMFFHGEAVTDEGGIYRLGGLPEGRIFLQASAPGRSPSRRVDVFLPSAEPVTASLLAGGLSLSGTVVDAETGEPLEGVTVMAISKPPGGPQWEGEHAVTRVDGAFALTAPIDGTNEIGVSAWLDGYEPAHVLFAQEPRADLAVRLTRRPEFRVLLRDEAGEPVTGVADVTLLDRVTLLRLDFGRADAEGIARFHVDPSRPLMVLVSAEGYDPAQEMGVRAEEGDHEIVLQRRATVTGTVRGVDGAPIAARVRLRREWFGQDRGETWAEVDPADGSYRAEGLELGEYTIDAFAPGFAAGRVLADVGAGEVATVDLTLEAGHVLTGVVRAADSGAPIAGARVGLADVFRARLTQKWMPGEVTTDAAGGFALTDVPAGEVALLVEHEAFVRRNATATAGPGAGPVDVRLERPATLEVRIVQADGTPAPFGFRATVKPEDGPTRVADAVDGVAVIEGLPPGRAGVACLPVSPSRSFSTTTSLAAGETKEVRFELSGGATVRGRLVDASGLGLDLHAFFVVVQEDAEALGGYLNAAFVAPDGTFRFDHAPVGDVVVALHGRAGTVAARDLRHVRLVEGDDAELTFEIGASGLRGRVVDRAGRGLDATVAVRATDAARGTWTRSDAASDGSFTILHRPAPLLVSASAAGFGTRAFPRVLSDQRTVLDERIVLDREARLELCVTDVDGEPVDAATVRVAPEEVPAAKSLFRARRVDEKRLLVERLPAGRHLLEVSAPGTVPHRRTVVLAPGDVRRETLRLRFAVDVELGFVDARGRPLGALAVRVEPSEDDPADDAKDAADARTRSATTDAAGTIVLPGLPEGSYAILAGDRRESLVLRRASDDVVAPARFLVTLD